MAFFLQSRLLTGHGAGDGSLTLQLGKGCLFREDQRIVAGPQHSKLSGLTQAQQLDLIAQSLILFSETGHGLLCCLRTLGKPIAAA